jgi:hypothetical protein
MAARKSFLGPAPQHPELDRLLEATKDIPVTDEQLNEQRVSFAFGNAPVDAELITKESVRNASQSNRIGHN